MRYGDAVTRRAADDLPPGRLAFAQRLRGLREERNLTQTGVARGAGLSRSYYANVEAGQCSPTVDSVLGIAAALGLRASTLFTGITSAASAKPTTRANAVTVLAALHHDDTGRCSECGTPWPCPTWNQLAPLLQHD
jgi:transcriptional regulator with XRE-family HTH domain